MAQDTFKIQSNPTPARVAAATLSSISNRVRENALYKKRGVNITLEQLEKFYTQNWARFMELHSIWKRNRFIRKFRPTLDRVDNERGYEVDNLQILPFGENVSKDMSKIITDWHSSQSKTEKNNRRELMKKISVLGGIARAKKLSAKRRKEIATVASHARKSRIAYKHPSA